MRIIDINKFVYLGNSAICVSPTNSVCGEIMMLPSKYTNRDQTCFVSELRCSKNDVEGTGDAHD